MKREWKRRKKNSHSLTHLVKQLQSNSLSKQAIRKNSQTNIRSIGQTIRQRSTSGLNMVEQAVTLLNSQKKSLIQSNSQEQCQNSQTDQQTSVESNRQVNKQSS